MCWSGALTLEGWKHRFISFALVLLEFARYPYSENELFPSWISLIIDLYLEIVYLDCLLYTSDAADEMD